MTRESLPEPPHREWLHALEDDMRVPHGSLQVARVMADFAATSGDEMFWVTWKTLRRCTHQSNNFLSESKAWLTDHGWLSGEPRSNGQKAYYRLVFPVDNPKETTPHVESAPDVESALHAGSATTPHVKSGSTLHAGSANVRTSGTSEENTAASRRDLAAVQRSPSATTRKGIDPQFIGAVAEELIGDLKANADEAGIITGMLDRGAHPKAVQHTISAERFGPTSQRRRSGPVCGHGRPYAADRWTDCQPPCYLSDTEPAELVQPLPDEDWPPPEPNVDPWGDPC